MVEHHKSADQIAEEAMAIFLDTEGMDATEQELLYEMLVFAVHQARGF